MNKWSNTCGFSGCSEQQLSWVSISLSPATKRCEGWQPGFSWDQCWHDCLNNDYLNVSWTLDEVLCLRPWMHVCISHVLEIKLFPFLFLVSLSGVLNVMWMLYLVAKVFKVISTRVTFFSPLTFPVACSAHMSEFIIYSVVLLHLFVGLFC